MNDLKSRHLFDISIELHPIQTLGATPLGERRVIPVSGGWFKGERLAGRILPHAGSDLLLGRADGSFVQDVRLTLEAEDGSLILMTYRGVRRSSPEVAARLARGETVPPEDYYLRIAPFYEAAASAYTWLNGIVSVGLGERQPNGARYKVFEIL